MNQTVVTLSPGAQPLHQALGFEARAVIVTNYTSSYVRLPDVGVDLPPFVYGAVVALPPGLRWAAASLVATVPAVSGPPVPIAQASLAWTDQPLPSSPGHLLAQSTFGQMTLVGKVTAASGVDTVKAFALPAGTQSIAVASRVSAGTIVRPAILSISDSTGNGNAYITQNPIDTFNWAFAPVVDATGISVDLNNGIGPGDTTFETTVYASPLPLATAIFVGGNQAPLPVVNAAGNILDVSLQKSTPAPWDAPNLLALRFTRTFPTTAATAAQIIAGVANQQIYIHELALVWDAAAAGASLHLVSAAPGAPAAGTIIGDVSMVITTPPKLGRSGGLGVGQSLYMWADSAVPASRGWLTASQG